MGVKGLNKFSFSILKESHVVSFSIPSKCVENIIENMHIDFWCKGFRVDQLIYNFVNCKGNAPSHSYDKANNFF